MDPTEVAGTLKAVKVVNFINHDHAEVKLNDTITFITGRNGSGKSAILAAVVVALGGRASTAGRGDSLYSLIKRGRDFAEVTVTLDNQGNGAFEPHIFGRSIHITRSFNKNKSNKYTIKSHRGMKIYERKEHVTAIVEHFNIQITNSFIFMNQDTSRTFLKTSSDNERYQLFCKGVQLNLAEDCYNDVKEARDKVAGGLREARGALIKCQDERQLAEQTLNTYTEAVKRHERLRCLESEKSWCQIAEVETTVSDIIEKVEPLRSNVEKKTAQSSKNLHGLSVDIVYGRN